MLFAEFMIILIIYLYNFHARDLLIFTSWLYFMVTTRVYDTRDDIVKQTKPNGSQNREHHSLLIKQTRCVSSVAASP